MLIYRLCPWPSSVACHLRSILNKHFVRQPLLYLNHKSHSGTFEHYIMLMHTLHTEWTQSLGLWQSIKRQKTYDYTIDFKAQTKSSRTGTQHVQLQSSSGNKNRIFYLFVDWNIRQYALIRSITLYSIPEPNHILFLGEQTRFHPRNENYEKSSTQLTISLSFLLERTKKLLQQNCITPKTSTNMNWLTDTIYKRRY